MTDETAELDPNEGTPETSEPEATDGRTFRTVLISRTPKENRRAYFMADVLQLGRR